MIRGLLSASGHRAGWGLSRCGLALALVSCSEAGAQSDGLFHQAEVSGSAVAAVSSTAGAADSGLSRPRASAGANSPASDSPTRAADALGQGGAAGWAAKGDPAALADATDDADAGVAAASASNSDAGTAVDGFRFSVFEANGPRISAPDREWTYLEFPDTKCRDGSAAGISVSLRADSKKVLIYLEGGAYCLDALTCAINPANVDDLLFNSAKTAPTTGIFDLKHAKNPVRDWNIVYVPYCSGDAMGGTKTAPSDVLGGPAKQYFSGHLNLQKFLQRIVPTFEDASDVLLVGMSAGGSSLLMNWVLVQRAFPWLKVRAINDSSLPPASSAVLPECLQARMRELWGLDQSALGYCGSDCPRSHDYWQDHSLFVVKLFNDRPSGFIDTVQDGMMRSIAGLGMRNCTGNLLFDTVDAELYERELYAYREKVSAFDNHSTFLLDGDQHTWIKDASFYRGSVAGIMLVDWFAKIADGQAAGHAAKR